MKIFMQTPLGGECKVGEHSISHMSYRDYLSNNPRLLDILKFGLSGSKMASKLRNPEFIHRLYIEKNSEYFRFLDEFKERYSNYDVIVMNPGVDLVHPEFLVEYFPNTLKCLHFVDDPHASYSFGFPFSWAFDCATYITPSYTSDFTMSEILKKVGFQHVKWMPHCVTNVHPPLYSEEELHEQLLTRNNKAIYVGAYYTNKTRRLIALKKELGDKFDIFGRYPLGGWLYTLSSWRAGVPTMYRVSSVSDCRREELYSSYSIGVNMHLSVPGMETGNARTYELAYRGIAQVVDESGASAISEIFEPEKEILTYSSIAECIEQVRRLQADTDLRMSLARNAYRRAVDEYQYPNRLVDLLSWFEELRKDNMPSCA